MNTPSVVFDKAVHLYESVVVSAIVPSLPESGAALEGLGAEPVRVLPAAA
jgi:hypothetical protein